jgi:hypothetical protein
MMSDATKNRKREQPGCNELLIYELVSTDREEARSWPLGAHDDARDEIRSLLKSSHSINEKLRSAICGTATQNNDWSTMSNQSKTNGEADTISAYDTDIASSQKQYCSFAVTGPQECFQAIYICQSCNDADGNQPLLACLCEACALACHGDHEGLEYVGTGPSYCDCHQLADGCKLEECSREKASQWDLSQGCLQVDNAVPKVSASDSCKVPLQDGEEDDDDHYVRDAFTIKMLVEEDELYARLQLQCKELVKHSRETFWLDATMDKSSLCDLELLAWSIFQQHIKHYNLQESSAAPVYGVEWWVQVKPVSAPEVGKSRLEAYTNGSEAVDLHYDKDEDLAESFGLGSFPALSTVTYLTTTPAASPPPPPTVIFPHRYDENDQDVIPNMLVSHARRGKHLVFDGRLLHGAPSHHALRPLPLDTAAEMTTAIKEWEDIGATSEQQWRITFLVNVWIGHKPAGVHGMPTEIRDKLQREHDSCHAKELFTNSASAPVFESREIAEVHVNEEEDLPLTLRGRIELPFLGKGTTWEDEDEDEEEAGGGMVLVTYPPPDHQVDTLLVRFGPDLEAFLRDLDIEEDEDEGEGQCQYQEEEA